MMRTHPVLRLAILMALFLSHCPSVYPAPPASDPLLQNFRELAPGVWLGNRPDSTRLPVTPNTTFVVSSEGVVVFDGGNLPLVADRVIAKIRAITDRPVTHVIMSHWHMDHVLGVSEYLEAFPNVQVIAHPYTRELILRYLDQREEGMRNTVADNVPGITALIERGAYANGEVIDAKTAAWFRQFLEAAELLEAQYHSFTPAYPNLLVSEELTILSGGREIRILHPGTGNTPGDLVMWLPEERILASGDIVVWPTPYGHGGRPLQWAETLRKLAAMNFRMLIPGHGDVLVNRDYLVLMASTLDSVASQMNQFAAQGMPLEAAMAALDLAAYEVQFTHGDAFLSARLHEWFTEPVGEAAWKIANGEDPEIVQPAAAPPTPVQGD